MKWEEVKNNITIEEWAWDGINYILVKYNGVVLHTLPNKNCIKDFIEGMKVAFIHLEKIKTTKGD